MTAAESIRRKTGWGTFGTVCGTLLCQSEQSDLEVSSGWGGAEVGGERGVIFMINTENHKEILGHVHPAVKARSPTRPHVRGKSWVA